MAGFAILRAIHILSGAAWVGTTFFLIAFVIPAVARSGEAGGRFMERLGPRIPIAIGPASGLTMLSGLAMYGVDSQGFHPSWILAPTGLTFTIGALAAIAAGILGGTVLRRNGPPAPGEDAAAAARRTSAVATTVLVLLGIAVVAMAVARYV